MSDAQTDPSRPESEADVLFRGAVSQATRSPLDERQAPLIFISYSHFDADFAHDLYDKLEKAGFRLWRDRSEMLGGEDWWLQIEEAIRAAETMVLVLSPEALARPIVAKEWRYARQEGTRVIPVIAQLIESTQAPRWMADLHWFDFRESAPEHELIWQRFLGQLRRPYQPVRVPFTVPKQPDRLVERRDEIAALLQLLLDSSRQNPVAVSTALRGGAGFGKTTLARAVCYCDEVQRAFSDGILWIPFGEHPNVLELLLDQIEVLTGARPGLSTVDLAARRLDEVLSTRKVLIVLDDVWSTVHVTPFLRVGANCAHLLTTRRQDIALLAQERTLTVNQMTTPQAVHVLTDWLSPAPSDLQPFEAMARRLGEWPLLLSLASSYLRLAVMNGNMPVHAALADLEERFTKRGFTALDRTDERQRDQAISISLEVSMERLGERRARYVELGIFPPASSIPFAAVERLWSATAQFDAVESKSALEAMQELSLFTEYDGARQMLSVHSAIQEYLAAQLNDPPTTHAKLVDAWGNPHALPDEYAWRRYIFHLARAGRREGVLQLMKDQVFLAAKLHALNSYAPIFEDMREAMLAAEALGDFATMLGLGLTYSGLQRKIHLLGEEDVIPLYARFGDVQRALNLAATIADPMRRATVQTRVAKEVLVADAPRGRRLLSDVLERWKDYESGPGCGLILREVLDIAPAVFIGFLEQVGDPSPLQSLRISGWGMSYEAIDEIGPRLDLPLKARLVDALIWTLPLMTDAGASQDLRKLLARFIDDPDSASSYADDDVARLVVACKHEAARSPEGRLGKETLQQLVVMFGSEERSTQDEKDVLFRYAIAPHLTELVHHARAERIDSIKVAIFMDLAQRTAQISERPRQAASFLLEALEMHASLSDDERARPPGHLEYTLLKIVEPLAAADLDAALALIAHPVVSRFLSDDNWHLSSRRYFEAAIAGAARTNPRAATLAVEQADDRTRTERARLLAIVGLARRDLAEAIALWREVTQNWDTSDDDDKWSMLADILRNAPSSEYPLAKALLDTEYRPTNQPHAYKIPALLAIAVALRDAQRDSASAIIDEAIRLLPSIFDEYKAKVDRETFRFLLTLPLARCGQLDTASNGLFMLSDDSGFRGIGSALLLEYITEHSAIKYGDEHLDGGSSEFVQQLRRSLENGPHVSIGLGGSSHFVRELAEFLLEVDSSSVTNLYFWHKMRGLGSDINRDYPLAITATRVARYDASLASSVAARIEDPYLRMLTELDLLRQLPPSAFGNVVAHTDDPVLRALAYVRAAARHQDVEQKTKLVQLAWGEGVKGVSDLAADFRLQLAVRLAVELHQVDTASGSQLSRQVVDAVQIASLKREAHRLLELNDAGYQFDTTRVNAINNMSEDWLDTLSKRAIKGGETLDEETLERFLCEETVSIGRSMLRIDLNLGLAYMIQASAHTNSLKSPTLQVVMRQQILMGLIRSGHIDAWKIAVRLILEYDRAMFDSFTWFVRAILGMQRMATDLPQQINEAMAWADGLMNLS